MEQLPPHVATADEPIPALRGYEFDGPDLQLATPIVEILTDLTRFRDDQDVVGYVDRFREHLSALGIDASIMIARDGTERLMVGGRCDAQIRHRSRWQHFLFEDLDRDEECRTYLKQCLLREGRFADNRLPNPRLTTTAIRDFIRTEGRILIDPSGHLTEGAGVPRMYLNGTAEQAAECVRASRVYFETRRRWRSDRQIKRAVRMLGKRTANGWMVLEAARAPATNSAKKES
jgi:hypothetical protein